ncbi:MAG TPA: class I SAM-dependent methyltransferase [Arenicellales bacterium]|jgi:ubiquinone/menaquinone biosynthesis C-methylase UbiE|nr:class I SAM-dependent methyltransferase [Arenicellales bacterium]|tara:strand:+ start:62 stop:694 length:633 start_codon:yes stop_codon:yes gene_type:complete
MTNKKGLKFYDNLDVSKTQNEDDLMNVYQKWAADYDDDNDNLLGTVSQPRSVQILQEYVRNKELKIIDVGCGTGLVGRELERAGFSNFDGIDISKEMIDIAKQRGYSNLFIGSLNDKLPFTDSEYDVALCVGVFTHGHVGSDRLNELVRIVKPGGIICFTINEGVYASYGFNSKIERLESEHVWKVIELSKNDYMVKKNVKGFYCLVEVQ